VPADCPPGVVALFCENVPILVTLRLPGVTVEADGAIFETWTCGDPSCATLSVRQQWSGTTTRARGIVRQLEGGTLSGGGVLAFDATTFALVTFDEV
jgi:hypothetical protein